MAIATLITACHNENRAGDGTQVRRGMAAIEGIPQDGSTLGRGDAPWTLSVISAATSYELDQLITLLPAVTDQLVRPGRLKVQMYTPSTGRYQGNGDDRIAAGALLAAGLQGRYWDALVRFVPTHRGKLTVDELVAMLRRSGVGDVRRAMTERFGPRVRVALARAEAAAKATSERDGVAYLLTPAEGPTAEVTLPATYGKLVEEISRLMTLGARGGIRP